jgi:glutaredoxin 3
MSHQVHMNNTSPPKVVVYTGTNCGPCTRAKRLLESKGVAFLEINVEEARAEMQKRSGGRRSVPQVFVGERHLGGFDDIAALDRKGELDSLLTEVDSHGR